VRRAAVALAGLVAAAAPAACGGDAPPLAWQGAVRGTTPPTLPTDRVLLARVRNTSDEPVRIDSRTIVVRDAGGRVLAGSVRFSHTFAHGLYGVFQQPGELPPDEVRRLGIAVTVPPTGSAPITVAWRLSPGAREPARLEYERGALALPRSRR
jgi:hypothetical protein